MFFKPVRGIDGLRKEVVLDPDGPASSLNKDYALKQEALEKKEIEKMPEQLAGLKQWWDDTAAAHVEEDKDLVKEANEFGGRMALQLTAAVPAFMFVGYLILVIYFAMTGGYKALEIDGKASK